MARFWNGGESNFLLCGSLLLSATIQIFSRNRPKANSSAELTPLTSEGPSQFILWRETAKTGKTTQPDVPDTTQGVLRVQMRESLHG